MTEGLRSEIRAWCRDHVPRRWRASQTGAGRDDYVAFQHWWASELRSAGYLAPHWPESSGGGGWTIRQLAVLYEELARADAPRLGLYFIGLHHTEATLAAWGTDDQRRLHLPAILDGTVWCQGFSEPEAGSDLAGLGTRAVRDGDDYVVTGQKIWSSMADVADHCLLLVRTDATAPKQGGITYLLLDMRSPGVDVRPIRQSTGDAEFCEIFLDEVRIPLVNRVGAENDGWRVARTTLATERGPVILELAEQLAVGFRRLVHLAGQPRPDGHLPLEDPETALRLADVGADVEILRELCRRAVDASARGAVSGITPSILKVFYSELLQRLTELGVSVQGLEAHHDAEPTLGSGWVSGQWMLDFVGSWSWTIAGGTNEIQRNVIAQVGLGLPR